MLVMSFLREFWGFLRSSKKFWMLPVMILLVILGALLVLAQTTAVAPFIYTIF